MIRSAWFTLVTAVLLALTPAYAQNFGEFQGTVTDASGAVIAGAQVTVMNTSTGVSREAETNAAGNFTVPFLNPGFYNITAVSDGFRTSTVEGRQLQVGDVARVNFQLEVGAVTEIVEVEASAELLDTSSTALGAVIQNEQIVDLPLNGRNYLSLVKLSPNVAADMPTAGQANSRQGGERAQQSISVAGQRQEFNRYTLDGADNTDPNFNTFIVRPSIDAIQEFKVQTGVYSAEFGKATSQINVTTKGGGNEFHGTFFEFLRNDKIQARPWGYARNPDGSEADKAPFRRNQFGLTVTGPIVKNKLFFMANYEGTRERVQGFIQRRVPDAAMRSGDFSAPYHQAIFDPRSTMEVTPTDDNPFGLVRTAYDNNIIPDANIPGQSRRLLEYLPTATNSSSLGDQNSRNFQRNSGNPIDWDQFTTRIDFAESGSSQWFGRYSWGDEVATNGGGFANQDQFTTTQVDQYLLSNTRTLSATVVNELRLGASIFDNDKNAWGSTQPNSIVGYIAIPGLNPPDPSADGIPQVNSGSAISTSGWGEDTNGPFIVTNRTFNILDNMSMIRGNHTIRFGVDLAQRRYNQVGNEFPRGRLQFGAGQTNDPRSAETRANTGDGFASFMAGVHSLAVRSTGLPQTQLRQINTALYVEDSWKMSPKLTVNLGLRYEYTPTWEPKNRGIMNVKFYGCNGTDDTGIDEDCQTPAYVRSGEGDIHEGLLFHFADIVPTLTGDDALHNHGMIVRDKNDWAPRIGIAYSPNGKTTIRTGFGVFYTQDTGNPVFDMARNMGAREQQTSDDRIPNMYMQDGPWAFPRGTQATCANWDGNCVLRATGFANDSERRTPYVFQYLFNIQRQVTDSMALEVGYQGNNSHRLQKMGALNRPLLPGGPGDTTGQQDRRAWGDVWGNIQTIYSAGNANYNALGVKLTQRGGNGLTYLVGYTWARSIDDTSGIRTSGGDNLYPRYEYDWRQERGPSQFHMKHRLTASFIYEVPRVSENAFANAVLGGWQLSTTLTFQTGSPRSAGGCPGGNAWATDNPGVNPNDGPRTQEEFWARNGTRPAAYDCTDPARAYNYGNTTRFDHIGPGIINSDFSIGKTFGITESVNADFRFESFNFANHPNHNPPSTTLSESATNYGVIALGTGARAMRINQFALKVSF